MTPEELEQQRKQEAAKRDAFKKRVRLQRALAATAVVATATQLSPLDRINQTVNTKIEDLRDKVTTAVLSLASQLGIEGIDSTNPTRPSVCPSQPTLDRALQIRNSLGVDIENTSKYIMVVDSSLQLLTPVINGTVSAVDALNVVKTATSLATKLIPVVPGAVTALLSDLDDIRSFLVFKSDGTPKLPQLKRALTIGSQYISDAAKILQTIVITLQIIDAVLEKCGSKPNGLGSDSTNLLDTVKLADSSIINEVYQGFTFSIVEKQFSPTLKQRIGQAKNSQGIVLLQTEPSFTTDPQVLVEELKLIIDRDNLKAN
jgi:hypothetical protein